MPTIIILKHSLPIVTGIVNAVAFKHLAACAIFIYILIGAKYIKVPILATASKKV